MDWLLNCFLMLFCILNQLLISRLERGMAKPRMLEHIQLKNHKWLEVQSVKLCLLRWKTEYIHMWRKTKTFSCLFTLK